MEYAKIHVSKSELAGPTNKTQHDMGARKRAGWPNLS